jgi:hypothetical protein
MSIFVLPIGDKSYQCPFFGNSSHFGAELFSNQEKPLPRYSQRRDNKNLPLTLKEKFNTTMQQKLIILLVKFA